jgi:hypothetical protein
MIIVNVYGCVRGMQPVNYVNQSAISVTGLINHIYSSNTYPGRKFRLGIVAMAAIAGKIEKWLYVHRKTYIRGRENDLVRIIRTPCHENK